jgi:N-acylneuraminate cytidylyltransferase
MSANALAVIPARGGSKRIPRKNIRLLSGRPLIAWTIETAVSSGLFSEVIVSTDDPEIAQIAESAGAAVPFIRPVELANDTATTGAVVAHAVEFMTDAGFAGDDVCCLYPSAIFVTGEDLIRARALLDDNAAHRQYVMSVVEYPHPIQRALSIGEDGAATPVSPEYALTRTQDLESRFHDAGQFYWGKAEAWQEMRPVLESVTAYVLPHGSVVDIDTEADWLLAERIHTAIREEPST